MGWLGLIRARCAAGFCARFWAASGSVAASFGLVWDWLGVAPNTKPGPKFARPHPYSQWLFVVLFSRGGICNCWVGLKENQKESRSFVVFCSFAGKAYFDLGRGSLAGLGDGHPVA